MIEKQIAEAALQQAKAILDNKDFWGGPGAAKTSADTLGQLLSVAEQARSKVAPDAPAPVTANTTKPVPVPENPATNGQSESADA